MKIVYSKTIISFLLVALLVGSNGCFTFNAVECAKGHPEEAYWIGKEQNRPDPNSKPQPAYYALLPLTIPADIVLTPVYIGYGIVCYVRIATGN